MSNPTEAVSVNPVLVLNRGSTGLKAAVYAGMQMLTANAAPVLLSSVAIDAHPTRDATEQEDADALLAAVVVACPTLRDGPFAIGHRIVHGADRSGPTDLTEETLTQLDALSHLAPLHQPVSLALVRASTRRWPKARQVGVFDTSWHRSMPGLHQMMAIPRELHDRGVKRFGFHGLAFQSALRQLAAVAPDIAKGRVVLAHLGGGSSLCAALGGRSVNTTMGMTPLGGIPMATRSGSLDPGVVLHLQRAHGMTETQIDRLLWHESGMKGISAESGDMRQLLGSSFPGAQLAIDVYVSAVAQAIASMATCIHGIDALVFTGGIGANAAGLRTRIVAELEWMGLSIDAALNSMRAPSIASANSSVAIYILQVDEQAEIYRALSAMAGETE